MKRLELALLSLAILMAGNGDFELFVVPGADHGLRDVSSAGDVPLHRQVGFGAAGWPKILSWLGERVDLSGPQSGAPVR